MIEAPHTASRFTCLVLALVGLSLAGCGSNPSSQRSIESSASSVTPSAATTTAQSLPGEHGGFVSEPNPTVTISNNANDNTQLSSNDQNAATNSTGANTVSDSATEPEITKDKEFKERKKQQAVRALNQKIAMQSFEVAANSSYTEPSQENYTVGSGDVLEIAVFQVEELNRQVRVSGDGKIMIPLLGAVPVGGKTTAEIELMLKQQLGETYLHDPQVSVFVHEYKSHQVAVLGAVTQPNIYSIRQPRTVLEMLAQAGGLTPVAGTTVQVRRSVVDPETNQTKKETLIMEVNAILNSPDATNDVILRGGDSIVVPEVGSIFIEGAIARPGAYEMRGETNVLKALSMAGGILFDTSTSEGGIEVYRENTDGNKELYTIDYNSIRSDPAKDIVLVEGDIVVVHHSSVKRGLSNFWKGVSGIFRVGL